MICGFCYEEVDKLYLCAVKVWTTNGLDDENFELCRKCFEKEVHMTVDEFFRPVPISIHHNLDGTRTIIKP